jgi:hypothetical protein
MQPAAIDRAIALMMEAASISETSVDFARPHGATTQKTDIFKFIITSTFTIRLQTKKNSEIKSKKGRAINQ